jgi:hypothetical protein
MIWLHWLVYPEFIEGLRSRVYLLASFIEKYIGRKIDLKLLPFLDQSFFK